MISGTVNARHEAVVPLVVCNAAGEQRRIEAILDTGFTGSLTLPPELIAELNLPWRSCSNAILANGNSEQFDIHAATVLWDGVPRRVLAQAIDNAPLLGMALLVGHDLHVRVLAGGDVRIEVAA